MNLHPDGRRLFYKLFVALLGYVNRKLAVVAEQFSEPSEYLRELRRASAFSRHRRLNFVRASDRFILAMEVAVVVANLMG